MDEIEINIENLYRDQAKIDLIPEYLQQARKMAGKGNDIILTGRGPVWLYLVLAHELHGLARSLSYDSPVTGRIVIFNHNPH